MSERGMRHHEYTSPCLPKPLEGLLRKMPAVVYPFHHTAGVRGHLCGTITQISSSTVGPGIDTCRAIKAHTTVSGDNNSSAG